MKETNMQLIYKSLCRLVVGGLLLGGLPLWGAPAESSAKAKPQAPARPAIKPRFEIKERDWPGQYGDASLCLWKDDAQAVLTITIDDNSAPDHPFWLSMGQKYGVRFTWCAITARITKKENPGFNGTWEDWRKIRAAGHDVQSHTWHHGHTEDPDWKGIDAEYANSKKEIEENMPGNKCLIVGYFGGPNSYMNDPAIAAKYYIGGRGGSGSLNSANSVDYMCTNNIGGIPHLGDAQFPSQDMKYMLEKGKAPIDKFYRGWCNSNFHGCSKDPERADVEKWLTVVKGLVQENKLWVGLFREVCLYGQERDTAKLKVTEKAPGKIVFNVTDTMDDALFDFPLTVKVRVDPSWKTVKATQGAKPVEAKLVQHEGATFALVQAVPDRGDVTLKNN